MRKNSLRFSTRLSVATAQATQTTSAVSMSASPTFTVRWLIPRLSTYQPERPRVEVRLTTSIAPVHFKENKYDIAMRSALEPMTGCDCVPFMTETIVSSCNADFVESGGLRSPADLVSLTLIRYTNEPYPWST